LALETKNLKFEYSVGPLQGRNQRNFSGGQKSLRQRLWRLRCAVNRDIRLRGYDQQCCHKLFCKNQ